ncbi:MAG: hypothetical protein IT371_28930 [Deltaproteobacteria bacterium]|nr:hypothetical protein [Deltaproteobacteria bacterium]
MTTKLMKNAVIAGLAVMVAGTCMLSSRVAQANPRPVAEAKSQRLPDDALQVKVVGHEKGREVLQVRNMTPFLVYIYIQGVRIGWLGPFRSGLLHGLAVGYHNMYGHSQWGSTYWGPRLVWVPGTWNLFR